MSEPAKNEIDHQRYARHLSLPDFGPAEQRKLQAARVLVIGAGGLGSGSLPYLVAAGVGTVGVVEFDTVDRSNLQRQILYNDTDVGQSKLTATLRYLQALNPAVNVVPHETQLSPENAREIIAEYDLVLDGSDNFGTRYLVNDTCVALGKPLVYASVFQYEGQLSVFNHTREEQPTVNLRDLFPHPPPAESVPNCSEGGVLGMLPGLLGAWQAAEAVKLVTGIGLPLSGKILLIDLRAGSVRSLGLSVNSDNPLRQTPPPDLSADYQPTNCETNTEAMGIPEIDVKTLKQWRDEGKDHLLIDVREPDELQICTLGGELMPLGTVADRVDDIPKDKPVVMQCRSGGRSGQATAMLQQMGYNNIYNLKGGILAWADEIDPSMSKY